MLDKESSKNTQALPINVGEHCAKVKAHIASGDRAIERGEQHYKSAGIYLKELKTAHTGSWHDWKTLLRSKINISTGRASELMGLADGRITLQELHAVRAVREAARRDRARASSPRGEEGGPPTPAKARKIALETNSIVAASDGYLYFPATKEQAKAGEDRIRMVFGVRRALDHLGGIPLTGEQFLAYAFPHQLWKPEEAPVIGRALAWLQDLNAAWNARHGARPAPAASHQDSDLAEHLRAAELKIVGLENERDKLRDLLRQAGQAEHQRQKSRVRLHEMLSEARGLTSDWPRTATVEALRRKLSQAIQLIETPVTDEPAHKVSGSSTAPNPPPPPSDYADPGPIPECLRRRAPEGAHD